MAFFTRRRIAWTAGLLALAVLLGIALLRKPAVPVEAARVERGPFEDAIVADGRTRVRERYVVSAPVPGILERISLTPGDRVTADTALAIIAPSPLDARAREELQGRARAAEASLAAAKANEAGVQATLEQAITERDRLRSLVATAASPAADLERAEATVHATQHALDAARSASAVAAQELAVARAALLGTSRSDGARALVTVRAPIAGVVLRVLQKSEAVVPPGAPLVEIGDPSSLEIVADVLTADAVRIPPRAEVRIERWGGSHPLEGRVRRVEPSAYTKLSALGVEEQRVDVLIDLESPRSEWTALGDGFQVDATIVMRRIPDAVKVPSSALFRQGDAWATFVSLAGRARLREVAIGARTPTTTVIERGLAPGEQVIVHPRPELRDGTRVERMSPGA